MLNRAQKEQLAVSLKEKFNKASVVLFANYRGIKALELDDLRKKVRESKGEVRVIKNNIARQAVADGSLGEDVKKLLDSTVGPTLVAFAYGDAAVMAKSFRKFTDDIEALELKESIVQKKLVSPDDVKQLADLPPKEVLLAQMLGTLAAPTRNFVTVLAAVPRNFLNALVAIEKKKGEQG